MAKGLVSFPGKRIMKGNLFLWILLTGLSLLNPIASAYGADEPYAYGTGDTIQPSVMLWAWERPEDLRFIDPRKTGVAFLARTIHIKGDEVYVRPRLQPLNVPQGTYLVAVARLQISRKERPRFSRSLCSRVASVIGEMKSIRGISAVQIDFDAKASERSFYAELIRDLRMQLPDALALSMTALTSWCIDDHWLSGLPVDEIVPMLFRMGPEGDWVTIFLEEGKDFKPRCRRSLGISTDEPFPKLPSGRRVYIFHPKPWSEEALKRIISEVRK
jgi:hypothetical protein